MNKIIIGLVGDMGSGKSTAAAYIVEKYGATRYSFSDMLKYILEYLKQPITRNNLIDLFLVLAPRFGEDVLARPMKETVAADSHPVIVVESIRREADIAELRSLPGFILVGISCDLRARYERIHTRGQRSDDAEKSFEEFVKDHEKKTETDIPEMVAGADYRIENDGSITNLQQKLDDIFSTISNPVK